MGRRVGDLGSELCLSREKEIWEDTRWDEQRRKKRDLNFFAATFILH